MLDWPTLEPIYPLKGYSLTLPAHAGAPHVSVTDAAHKVVYARMDAGAHLGASQLRIAAMVDVVGHDQRVTPTRVQRMWQLARDTFPRAFDAQPSLLQDAPHVQTWAGLRPATPTGVPIIRAIAPNVWVNAGHGGLGFTLAAGSATRVLGLVDEFLGGF